MNLRLLRRLALVIVDPEIPNNGKPYIWIQTDGTAITGFTNDEAITDRNSDPDDQVALANYLMLANKVNTVGIVMGVTNRNTSRTTL
jgi:hypothetical protein